MSEWTTVLLNVRPYDGVLSHKSHQQPQMITETCHCVLAIVPTLIMGVGGDKPQEEVHRQCSWFCTNVQISVGLMVQSHSKKKKMCVVVCVCERESTQLVCGGSGDECGNVCRIWSAISTDDIRSGGYLLKHDRQLAGRKGILITFTV